MQACIFRFSSLRAGISTGRNRRPPSQVGGNPPSSSTTSPTKQQQEEQVQRQVQIRDLRSIPAAVKSTDYILARIRSHAARGSPVDLVATTAALNGDGPDRQRKV